jgi:hypothetical protein
MVKHKFVQILLITLLLTACTQGIFGTTPPTESSGIVGHVTLGPMCPGPVRVGDTTCQDQPYQAKITVLGENNKRITQFDTDSNGYFKIDLIPGTYILHPEPGNPLPVAADQTVIVPEETYTEVAILYDTGMR